MEQYDVSPEMKKLYEKKTKQRALAKEYYRNMIENPYRPINDGAVFDSGSFRFSAMSAYHVELFKPTPKSYMRFFGMLSPILMVFLYLKSSTAKKEELLRSGMVRYEDRHFRFAM